MGKNWKRKACNGPCSTLKPLFQSPQFVLCFLKSSAHLLFAFLLFFYFICCPVWKFILHKFHQQKVLIFFFCYAINEFRNWFVAFDWELFTSNLILMENSNAIFMCRVFIKWCPLLGHTGISWLFSITFEFISFA